MFAPVIAYEESWELQQQLSRVVRGAYLESTIPTSWRKFLRAMHTRQGKAIVGVGVGIVALSTYTISRCYTVIRYGSPVCPPAPRLVNVELNPGDIVFRSLINCARLPKPKKLKSKAKIGLSEGEVRMNIHLKDPEEKRGMQAIFGFDTAGYAPVAFASNQHNEEQALYARVLADTIEPISDELEACLEWCRKNHKFLFPRMHKVVSVSFDEYLLRSNAAPSVKKILRRTYDRLVSDGIYEDSCLSSAQLYNFTARSSFVKVENNLYWTPLGKKQKAPRLIQGAMPEFICIVGPWIMALQDLLKRRWNTKKSNIVFTSGVKSEQAAQFIAGGQGEILEDDLGKFDCSIRRPWCEYEVWLAKKFFAPRAVVALMRANIKTHGSTLHGWKYKCDGTRKSGDPYTSLMNSIINGLSHLYLYCKWTGRSVVSARKSIRMLVQGDDNLMRHVERKRFNWPKGMASLGFDSEAIYRKHLEEAEFCSNRLYFATGGWVFGPKPGKVLAKFGFIINPPKHVTQESMMRGVALGLQKSCNFIPPIKCVIERVLELTEGHDAYYERKFLEHTMKNSVLHECTIDILLSLDEQYDWSVYKQVMFEKSVKSMKLGDVWDQPLTQLLFDRDTSGPQQIFARTA